MAIKNKSPCAPIFVLIQSQNERNLSLCTKLIYVHACTKCARERENEKHFIMVETVSFVCCAVRVLTQTHTSALLYINILSCTFYFLILKFFNIVEIHLQHSCLKFITESAFCSAKPAHLNSTEEKL